VRKSNRKKGFFFEKKNQKTFAILGPAVQTAHIEIDKVFCYLFSEKKSFFPATTRGTAPSPAA